MTHTMSLLLFAGTILMFDISADLHKNAKFNTCKNLKIQAIINEYTFQNNTSKMHSIHIIFTCTKKHLLQFIQRGHGTGDN